ncbi:MAG: FG-GAP-like repeat-containing protein, partial [Bacteroidota bacterium]
MRVQISIFSLSFFLLFTACQNNQDPNSDPRFNGNRLMVKVLDSLNTIADPNTNYYLSGRRAAQMLEKSHTYTNPEDIINWETKYCFELLNAGNVDECIKTATAMINKYPGGGEAALADPNFKKVFDLLAVAYLRMGENDNCIANHNSASCIVPLKPKAFHKNTKGSLTAIEFYTQILRVYPSDYQSKWLMNIAYMTLGKYPAEVPKAHFIDFSALDEKVTGFVPLENLAIELGVDVNGLAGAAIIEDFNNDGFMDIFCSSYGLFDDPNLFMSDGKGGYNDETAKAMLTGISGGLNAKQADFNNDGLVDILVLRG